MTSSTVSAAAPEPALSEQARAELDRDLARLARRRDDWARLPLQRKIRYARTLLRGLHRVAAGQVEAAVAEKGGAPDSPVAAEEWLAGPYVALRTLRILISTLEQLRDRGRIALPAGAVVERPDGRLSVRVFPLSLYDKLLYAGFSADVWIRPGVDRERLERLMGRRQRGATSGRIALVLGAGNVASIGPLDAVHKLFAEGQVVLLKLNPVNAYLRPFIEDAFAELIADGYLAVAEGGGAAGAYLCRHDAVDEIHITGSARTHDLIVFGPGEEGRRRKAAGEPRLDKRITSELGNVSPMILVPGRWSGGDLDFHAANVATQMTQNAGFNCNATKVLVTHEAWPQREEFLERLGQVLATVRRKAYYPGAEQRYRHFVGAYPQTRFYGEPEGDRLPPALAAGVDPGDDGPAFREESFCAFTAETRLPGADAADFLERAVAFCNERLYGTLNAGLVVHPETRKELGARLDEAVQELRYGSVALNHWPALSYGLGSTPWGAYPGHTLDDIQSGIGVVHNALLLEETEKAVIDGPFRVFPKPVWFITHGTGHRVGPHLAALEADPGPQHLPPIFFHALLG